MEREINTYVSMLQSGIDNNENINISAKFLLSKDSRYLSENKVEIANLFYQILCANGRLYGDLAHEKTGTITFELFDHVSGINTDETTRSNDSNLMTIWFLNVLYQNFRNGQGFDTQLPISVIQDWMMGLDDIKYVFKIRDENNEKYFPINRLIIKVLQDKQFISIKKLTQYHIRIFQLAVELFEDSEEQKILKDLQDKCNLKFLEYFDGTQEILDSEKYMNCQKNGVMIFYNESKKSILIRHEKKEYFLRSIDGLKREIQTEYNIEKKPIGYFVTVDVENILLRSYRDVITQYPKRILELIYKYGCYNIFFDKALMISDNVILPINPYTAQDKYIIDNNGNPYIKEKIRDILLGYNLSAIKNKGLDFVSIGLCITLLQKENVGIDALGLDGVTETDWYQNQVISNWVLACKDSVSALKTIMILWNKELDYMSKVITIQEHHVETQNLMPYKCNLEWMYSILKLPSYPVIYEFVVDEDENGKKFLKINDLHTLAGKLNKRADITNPDEIVFDVDLSKDEENEFWELDAKHYIIYDEASNQWSFSLQNQPLYAYLTRIELLNEKGLSFDIRNLVSISAIDKIKTYMHLHEKSLLLDDVNNHDAFQDFDAIAVYRIIHNMLWNEITSDKWDAFYKIIVNHQMLDYSKISEDITFHLDEAGVLYVPKENQSRDGSLSRIYSDYLKNNTSRTKNNLYSPILSYNEIQKKYCINGVAVNKIVFLFDNICYGSSTITSLAAYLEKLGYVDWLNKETLHRAERSILKYTVGTDVITVKKIIETNVITQIEVHSYYGTTEGEDAVKEFLYKCGAADASVSYHKSINKKAECILEELKEIWPKYWKDATKEDCKFYIFIREFNQPKKNVFPSEMLSEPKKAICMFVQKDELKNS